VLQRSKCASNPSEHRKHLVIIMTTPRGFTNFRLPMVPGMAAPSPRRSDYKRHSVFDIKQGKLAALILRLCFLCNSLLSFPSIALRL
jgi:hypothetical protein